MKWKDMIGMSLSNLFKRKVRTLLTIAGVIIGTCAIVVMVSFGIGIKAVSYTHLDVYKRQVYSTADQSRQLSAGCRFK